MSIRTTVTLDEDVLDGLKRKCSAKGIAFKEALNETLREGLRADIARHHETAFTQKTFDMGSVKGVNYDNISELIEQAEGPGWH